MQSRHRAERNRVRRHVWLAAVLSATLFVIGVLVLAGGIGAVADGHTSGVVAIVLGLLLVITFWRPPGWRDMRREMQASARVPPRSDP